MIKIGSDEFPFRLETFIKNNGEIDVHALMTADLGEFSPEDLLYEFYTRTTLEIAEMRRDVRRIRADNPKTTTEIVMLREECAVTRSKISKMEEELIDLRERNRLVKEIRHLKKSIKSAENTQQPSELGVTLPSIYNGSTQVLQVNNPNTSQNKRRISDSQSSPNLPPIGMHQQYSSTRRAQGNNAHCGNAVNGTMFSRNGNKRVRSFTNASARESEYPQMRTDATLSNLKRRHVPRGLF
ncbi:uncharacterized protein LOC134237369 [Saccostrea cucullata]|uniref:uncharacterized protein LOC134237369 n=1 Tax=Saccostrea cuccullata TaxID=36930 RepID=UPI002ED105D1